MGDFSFSLFNYCFLNLVLISDDMYYVLTLTSTTFYMHTVACYAKIGVWLVTPSDVGCVDAIPVA